MNEGKAPKEIHVILTATLEEHAPSYTTVKKWVAQFKRGNFSTCVAPCPGRNKTVTMPEKIDQIHELLVKDRQISVKTIAEQLGISRKRVGSIIHEDLDMRKLSAKWVPKCLNADQKRQRCQFSEQSLKFFRLDPNDFLSRLVTTDEACLYHYNPETNSNKWSGGIAANPAPENSESKNLLEKLSPKFFGIKTASSSFIIFQRAKLSTRGITHPHWCK